MPPTPPIHPLLYQKNIDVSNPAFDDMLNHLQANILKYHGRQYAWHVFLTFTSGKETELKNWIRQYASRVTPARKQLMDAAQRKTDPDYDGGTVVCFFLSETGYKALGFEPRRIGFKGLTGMRGSAAALNDLAVDKWQPDYQQQFDAMILLADENKENLARELDSIRRKTAGMTGEPFVQKGEALRNADQLSIEHLGYADGISQPKFLNKEASPGKTWDDNTQLRNVLMEEFVKDYEDCFGSFFVFRKLEQNVKLFNQKVRELADTLFPNDTSPGATSLAAAYVIGRFKDGTPVVKHPQRQDIHREQDFDNDFNYHHDTAGSKCPFHAHIRITAPRDIASNPYEFRRIVRRGIPYDEAGRNGDMEWSPEKEVGMLFMCYQADIQEQFEHLQATWAGKGDISDSKQTAMDGLIGQDKNNTRPQEWPATWDGPGKVEGFRFSDTVTLKGGEYFFAPSIPFLQLMVPF